MKRNVAVGLDGLEADLVRFVANEVAVDGEGLRADERLVESGRIDSLGLVQLLAHVRDRYAVDLLANGRPQDLESLANLAAAIRRERDGAAPAGADDHQGAGL